MSDGKKPDGLQPRRNARAIGDLVSKLVEPVVARKAGMTVGLISAWPEIVGQRLEEGCRPEKLLWPKGHGTGSQIHPATLVIACEGAFVLRLQHETQSVMDRVNAYFGYRAVARVKIVQRPVRIERKSSKLNYAPLTGEHREAIDTATARIENGRLKAALERLGETVLGRNAAERRRGGTHL